MATKKKIVPAKKKAPIKKEGKTKTHAMGLIPREKEPAKPPAPRIPIPPSSTKTPAKIAPKKSPVVRCEHCGAEGHTIDQCKLKKQVDHEEKREAERRAELRRTTPDVEKYLPLEKVWTLKKGQEVILSVEPASSATHYLAGIVEKVEKEKTRIHVWTYTPNHGPSFITLLQRGDGLVDAGRVPVNIRPALGTEPDTIHRHEAMSKKIAAEQKSAVQLPPSEPFDIKEGTIVTVWYPSINTGDPTDATFPGKITDTADMPIISVSFAYDNDGRTQRETARLQLEAKGIWRDLTSKEIVVVSLANQSFTDEYYECSGEKPPKKRLRPGAKEAAPKSAAPKSKTPFDNLKNESAKFRDNPPINSGGPVKKVPVKK